MKKVPKQARQSRVDYKNQHGKSPNEGYCYKKGKLALASVGATKQAQKRCQAPTPISSYGGGMYVNSGTFRIVTGTIYGSNEADTSLKNTATTSGGGLV